MNPDLTQNETLIEDGHAYGAAQATADLERIHNVYRDTLEALTASAIKNRVKLSTNELKVAMEGVGEALATEAEYSLSYLPNESYTPSNAKHLIQTAHAELVLSLRPEPIDWNAAFKGIFRPQSTRGSAPSNPATLLTKGNDL